MKTKVIAGAVFCLLTAVCMADAPATATMGFPELALKRHSGYAYDSTRSVTLDQLRQLAAAARLSPSSYNEQPWRFIICDRDKTPQAYQKAFNCLVKPNQEWAKNVPVLVVVVADMMSSENHSANRWAQYDTGAAAMSLLYQATALGLMAHEMGGFDEGKVRQEFAIPADTIPMAIIAVGYEAAADSDKTPTKTRRPQGDNFFLGNWGTGLE